ncbi:MAG TPA: helix-turn-helix domain-containing protein [Candidatus Saccharimonadales bacterium]|nr:helix-turn-helix domain-containing protein [Candidatus Saccharimonadales bacterium]
MEDTIPRAAALRRPLDKPKPQRLSGDEVLTVPEACQYLRISKWSLYRMIQGRKIRTVKMGNRRLLRMQSIQELLDELEGYQGV